VNQPNANPDKAEEIRLGVANACLMMPGESTKRAEEINRLHHLVDEEKEAVAEAKETVGVGEHAKRLKDVYGIAKPTLAIMKILDKVKKHGDRAAVITQVNLLSKDVGYVDKDLVTLAQEAEATAGQGSADQGSVFDKTSEGQRRGGKDAQPKHVAQPAAASGPAPTPGIPLDEALKQLEAYNAANPPKRGAKPAERKRLEALVEEAKVAGTDPLAEKPAAEPGQVSQEMSEGVAEADAHLKGQIAGADAPPPAPRGRLKAVPKLDDDLPPAAPKKGAALAGASGTGSYTLN
jgi:hypothetical protein